MFSHKRTLLTRVLHACPSTLTQTNTMNIWKVNKMGNQITSCANPIIIYYARDFISIASIYLYRSKDARILLTILLYNDGSITRKYTTYYVWFENKQNLTNLQNKCKPFLTNLLSYQTCKYLRKHIIQLSLIPSFLDVSSQLQVITDTIQSK